MNKNIFIIILLVSWTFSLLGWNRSININTEINETLGFVLEEWRETTNLLVECVYDKAIHKL